MQAEADLCSFSKHKIQAVFDLELCFHSLKHLVYTAMNPTSMPMGGLADHSVPQP
jgi:hypothetical protein